jgi:hypothetical protein
MKDRNGNPLQPRSVPVDADGQPARPLPPEGSYARQQIEAQRAAAAARMNPQQPVPTQPAAQNGQPQGQPPQQPNAEPPAQDASPNAQRRFSELTATLRQREQALQQAEARSRQLEESHAQLQARLQSVEEGYKKVIGQNLESLDPETRAAVMQDARMTELVAGIESRLLQRIDPMLKSVRDRAAQDDLSRLATKYPGFRLDTHLELIEIFREKNPNCSIEQAFRAVAEPEELALNQDRAPAIPPIAMPSPGNAAPRYVPQPDPKQLTPEQEVELDRQRAFKLARSTDTLDRRDAGRAMDQLLRSKLAARLPKGPPSYQR